MLKTEPPMHECDGPEIERRAGVIARAVNKLRLEGARIAKKFPDADDPARKSEEHAAWAAFSGVVAAMNIHCPNVNNIARFLVDAPTKPHFSAGDADLRWPDFIPKLLDIFEGLDRSGGITEEQAIELGEKLGADGRLIWLLRVLYTQTRERLEAKHAEK